MNGARENSDSYQRFSNSSSGNIALIGLENPQLFPTMIFHPYKDRDAAVKHLAAPGAQIF
jgi:hypothetical protein